MELWKENKPSDGKAPLTLKRNFLYTASANLIYAFSQWLIILLIAKLGAVMDKPREYCPTISTFPSLAINKIINH
ncbi:hypothetical protein ACT4UM_02230 [Bacillus sp. SS-TM]